METIKAKELMTGDWITGNNGEPTQVQNILVEAVMTTDGQGLDERDGEIHPVPLTTEILEKVEKGFGRGFEFGYGKQGGDRWHIEIISTSTYFYTIEEMILKIRYVHELQHAMRLCGTKKEVVL